MQCGVAECSGGVLACVFVVVPACVSFVCFIGCVLRFRFLCVFLCGFLCFNGFPFAVLKNDRGSAHAFKSEASMDSYPPSPSVTTRAKNGSVDPTLQIRSFWPETPPKNGRPPKKTHDQMCVCERCRFWASQTILGLSEGLS